jgi:hypothetical protein
MEGPPPPLRFPTFLAPPAARITPGICPQVRGLFVKGGDEGQALNNHGGTSQTVDPAF